MRDSHLSLLAAVTAAGFWGLSGTAAQALFALYGFPVLGLVPVRMLCSSLLVIALIGRKGRPPITATFVLLSLLGIAGSQLTYLEAIRYSNAVTATLLQFLFLPMVAAYEGLRGEIRWSWHWSATLGIAVVGTVLLVANTGAGSLGILITPIGALFGLLSAASGAYYSIAGGRLVKVHGTWPLTAWGFLVGGLVTLPAGAYAFATYSFPASLASWAEMVGLVAFVIVFGTLLGYGLYLFGLRHLPATEVGVAASVEPISAGVATHVFLGVTLSFVQYIGGALIVVAVALLGLRRRPRGGGPAPVAAALPPARTDPPP